MQPLQFTIPLFVLLFILDIRPASAASKDDKASKTDLVQQTDFDPSINQDWLPPGIRLVKDFSYGIDSRQGMDIYLPPHPSHAPVLFMVHGGGWRIGDKSNRSVVNNKVLRWVPKGFVFISVNYRMLPDADPLTQAEDVARALVTAQANAASWGADPAKFILMGHSAGAHLVDLLTAAPDRAYSQGARPWLGTVSLDSGAVDVVQIMERKHYRLYDQAFGRDPAYWKSVSPLHQFAVGAPPILAVCSTSRPDRPCRQAHRLAAQAAMFGARVTVLEQALTHRQINQELGLPGAYTYAVEVFMGTLDKSVGSMLMSGAARIR